MIWNSSVLASITNGQVFSNWQGNKIVFDSRLVEKDDIFIALPGENSNGHNYVKQALEKGAGGAIVARIPDEIEDISRILLVKDTLEALTIMAHYKRNKSRAKFIAITGSVGKTSTKELLGSALATYGNIFIGRGNYNNFLGVPINLASIPDNCEFAILEMGMDHAGELTPLTQMVKPHVAIITAIENIHRANFDSIEGIAKAKSEIFKGIEQNGIAIISSLSNCYDVLLQEAKNNFNVSKIIDIGTDCLISSYEVKNNQTYASIRIENEKLDLHIKNIIGKHQVHNMMVVLNCMRQLNLSLHQAIKSLEEFQLPRGRGAVLNIEIANKRIILIDDSYNAGPVSVKAALKNLSYYSGRKIAILGDMGELGEESLQMHLSLREDIILNKIDKVICVKEQMGELFLTLPEEVRLGSYKELKTLARDLPNLLQNGDILLIKGSHYLTRLYYFTQHLVEGTLDAI